MPDSFDFTKKTAPLGSGDSRPLLTYLLCGLSVLVTLAFFTSSDMPGSLWYRIGHLGYPGYASVWEGHTFFLFTAIFNHLSYGHIIFNMLWLLQLGAILELTLRPWQYALFILGAAVVGSCGEIAIGGIGVGMSGVVYAMFGLLWAGRGRYPAWRAVATRQNLNLFVGWGLLCVFLTYAGIMPVGNGAHGAGFVFGLSIGWLFFAPRRQPVWWLALIGLAAMCVLALTYVPWSASWQYWKGTQDFTRGAAQFERGEYLQAIQSYQRSRKRGVDGGACWHNIGVSWRRLEADADMRGDLSASQADGAQADQAFAQENASKQADVKAQASEPDDAPLAGELRPRLPQSAPQTKQDPSRQDTSKTQTP